MIDKLLINNQLLASKKTIQKVKTICINRLVQKIRTLKKLNQDDKEENKKNFGKLNGKLRKATETLQCLKKMDSLEAIKKLLLFDKKPLAVITNGSSTPEELSDALIMSQKLAVDLIKNIKDVAHLNDVTNPNWKEEIQELSKRKKKHLRTEEKKIKRAKRKLQNEQTKNRSEWMKQNAMQTDVPKDESSNEVIKAETADIECPESSSAETKENSRPAQKSKTKKVAAKSNSIQVETKEEENASGLEEENASELESEAEEEVQRTVDPFFVTRVGENYLSTAVISRVQEAPPDDGLVRRTRRNLQKPVRYSKPNGRQHHKNIQVKSIRFSEKGRGRLVRPSVTKNGISKIVDAKSKSSQNPRNTKQSNAPSTAPDLHPSWVAKQRLKPAITAFKGKKITFDSEESNVKNIKKSSTVSTATDLHPSWVAKQKLKPAITAFQGKKITFDAAD